MSTVNRIDGRDKNKKDDVPQPEISVGGSGPGPIGPKEFSFTIISDPGIVNILVNGIDTGLKTPYKLVYNSDLLSIPKEITVSRSGYLFNNVYKIKQGPVINNNGTDVQSVTIEQTIDGNTTLREGGLESDFQLGFQGRLVTESPPPPQPTGEVCEYRVNPLIGDSKDTIARISYLNGNNVPITVTLTQSQIIFAKEDSIRIESGAADIDLIECVGDDNTPPPSTPSITLTSADNPTINSIKVGGSIYKSNSEITEAAVVASQTPNAPRESNIRLALPTSAGEFTGTLGGLTSNTIYYVRAYIITNSGTFFSEEFEITTLSATSPPPPLDLN